MLIIYTHSKTLETFLERLHGCVNEFILFLKYFSPVNSVPCNLNSALPLPSFSQRFNIVIK